MIAIMMRLNLRICVGAIRKAKKGIFAQFSFGNIFIRNNTYERVMYKYIY